MSLEESNCNKHASVLLVWGRLMKGEDENKRRIEEGKNHRKVRE
jgi:hypothetical protein